MPAKNFPNDPRIYQKRIKTYVLRLLIIIATQTMLTLHAGKSPNVIKVNVHTIRNCS